MFYLPAWNLIVIELFLKDTLPVLASDSWNALSCRSILEEWMRGSFKCIPFAIPRIWKEHTNHHDDYYFCMVSKYKKTKNRKKIVYPSIPLSIAPVNYGPDCLFLNLQQRMLYHQPYRNMTMLILRLTLSVPAKILIFRVKMNWMI